MLLVLLFGLIIGIVVGAVGGGGAVLAVPILVYIVGMGVHDATTASLAVVAMSSATGAIAQARRGAVCWTSAAWFAVAASVGSLIGAVVNQVVGGAVLLLVFSVVMLLASRATWQRAGQSAAELGGCPQVAPRLIAPIGFGIGTLTGLVGVGGGFVIVPALAVGLSFGMREAMGTSMVVVGIVSVAGLLSHLLTGSALDVPVALSMGGAAVVGALLGPRLASGLSTRFLGRAFSLLVAVVAVAVAGATVAGVSV